MVVMVVGVVLLKERRGGVLGSGFGLRVGLRGGEVGVRVRMSYVVCSVSHGHG
jgi:hypothetical protein